MTDPANLAEAIRAYNEGVRAMQEGDSEGAAGAWRHAVELDPGMAPALRNLVVYYEQRGRTQEVIDTYAASLAFDPFDTEALIRQASAYRRVGQVEPAIANYERAIAVYPYFRFWYDELATLYDQIDDNQSSAVWRARALELDSDEAEMAFEDGVRQQRGGNHDLAIAIFEAVLEEAPANLDARIRLADCLQAVGRTNDGLHQLDQAFELTDAAPALALFHRGRLALEVGQVEEGIRDLQAAIDSEPTYGRARRLLERARGGPPGKPHDTSSDAPRSGVGVADESLPGERSGTGPRSTQSNQIQSHEPELEPDAAQAAGASPDLQSPPADKPWLEQIRFMIRQACEIDSRTGKPGRVAVLLESAATLVPLANSVMQLVARPDLKLFGAGVSRAFFVEGEPRSGASKHGVTAEGWFGASYFEPDYGKWSSDSEGIPIDRMLESAQLAVGSDGFNLMLVIATGRVRPDQQATIKYLRAVPTYQTALVLPPDAAGDLAEVLRDEVPNFVTVAASRAR